MKTIIALLACGIVYASALPRCSEEELSKCNPTNEKQVGDIETSEQLEDRCRYTSTVLQCEVDFIERCPNNPLSNMLGYMKEMQRVFKVFCDKSNPLRKKFLDNARCLNQFSRDIAGLCSDGEIISVHDEASCKKLKNVLKCSERTVAEKCGEDAKEAYLVLLNPEFQLRTANCL